METRGSRRLLLVQVLTHSRQHQQLSPGLLRLLPGPAQTPAGRGDLGGRQGADGVPHSSGRRPKTSRSLRNSSTIPTQVCLYRLVTGWLLAGYQCFTAVAAGGNLWPGGRVWPDGLLSPAHRAQMKRVVSQPACLDWLASMLTCHPKKAGPDTTWSFLIHLQAPLGG